MKNIILVLATITVLIAIGCGGKTDEPADDDIKIDSNVLLIGNAVCNCFDSIKIDEKEKEAYKAAMQSCVDQGWELYLADSTSSGSYVEYKRSVKETCREKYDKLNQ